MEVNKTGLSNNILCVEYPGTVKNVDRMLDTLGGVREISRVYSKKNRRLELRFRPDDVVCKPACGDRIKTNAVLLKIRVRVKKNGNDDSDGELQKVVGCSIVGRIQTLFKFKSICDFQFLPMFPDKDGVMRDISRTLLPPRVDGDSLERWLLEPTEHFLPPAAFSRIDAQSLSTYMYRKEPKDAASTTDDSLIGRTRKRRGGYAVFVSFDVKSVPSKPRERALKFLEVKFLSGEKYDAVKKCFEDRPIWSKFALMCFTGFQYDQLKYLLPSVAYYFITGPYRVMWVRFGYDPRKDPSSRIYQTLDYRIRPPVGLLNKVKAKRSYSNYLLPTKSTHAVGKSVTITKNILDSEQEASNGVQVDRGSYQFFPEKLPPSRQIFYQYCDIKVAEIEAMLSRLPKITPDMPCDSKYGWLPPGFDTQCREIINNHVVALMASSVTGEESIQEGIEEDADDSSDGEKLQWEEDFDEEDVDETDLKDEV